MIQGYLKKQFLEQFSEHCKIYKVEKEKQLFLMYEYTQFNMRDQYNLKIISKFITCENVLGVIERFQVKNKTYVITKYVSSNLLKQQLKQAHQIFELAVALKIFAKIVQLIEDIHSQSVYYRNLKLETIGFEDDKVYLSDFGLSQIVKRKQRYFECIGTANYFAPQLFQQDGYGYEMDIWAAGVCLYYMLTGSFPFNMQNKNQKESLQELQKKCKNGFDFVANASKSNKAAYIKSSKSLEDLFKRIFQLDYCERITIKELKCHPALKQYFQKTNKIDLDLELMVIVEQNEGASIFKQMLSDFKCHHQFHKEQVIFDFMEHSSEALMLQSPEIITQEIRTLVNFSILKAAVLKINHFNDILYGQRQPEFKIPVNEWQEMKKKAGFLKVRQKMQRKKKILGMLFRSACQNIKKFRQRSSYYSQQIPVSFAQIKKDYRQNLSKMFEIGMVIVKKKENKQKNRKICMNLARLVILWMVNRIFQEQNWEENFKYYFLWSKTNSLQRLEQWIESQKLQKIKSFIKKILHKYNNSS